jgi:HEAT repeat protein
VVIAACNDVQDLDRANDPKLAADLRALSKSSNPLIAGAALRGLGATKAPGTYALLLAGLNRHAFREPIARGAVAGLANYGDVKALSIIRSRTVYGVNESERTDAIAALGKLGKRDPGAVAPYLQTIALHDPYFRARASAVSALGRLGQRSSIAALRQVQTSDSEEDVQNAAWDAIHTIQTAH